ncbi:hypothetical protein SPRG_15641 [Saprolegnia parasitica CBS 223.65]|uniref:Fatty acid hydroxylase domain-containing protein n=1 Tax=Saprolegnia parasitica (strain CBS 223.65) TaxID=695850 RepID=A0A067BLZ9_SAPPC|nr:hypothetical protein SPRG_15641 [Saprolegnia parasitica CBS 223.65]KDO19198.1 hypothetical protein SPRG_15641 [Saprolegnia parasitica CBS 223.65]|eukprot:XP_012210098.1 hypothetical protein SPRG_15641 [Saprolegnia parasitica CBS 223.65]
MQATPEASAAILKPTPEAPMIITSGPFDCIIRSPDTPGPLAFLNGLPYFAMAQMLFAFNAFILINWYGSIGAIIGSILAVGSAVVDGFASNSFGENVRTLRHNGFSDWTVLSAMAFAIVLGEVMNVVVIQNLAPAGSLEALFSPSTYTRYTLFGITTNIAIVEVLFYVGHMFLHEAWPEIHVMHHCTLGGPGAIVIVNHFLLWEQDPTILLVTFLFVTWAYSIIHHEWYAGDHVKHHARIDSVYTVYVKHHGDARKNLLKGHIRHPPKK